MRQISKGASSRQGIHHASYGIKGKCPRFRSLNLSSPTNFDSVFPVNLNLILSLHISTPSPGEMDNSILTQNSAGLSYTVGNSTWPFVPEMSAILACLVEVSTTELGFGIAIMAITQGLLVGWCVAELANPKKRLNSSPASPSSQVQASSVCYSICVPPLSHS